VSHKHTDDLVAAPSISVEQSSLSRVSVMSRTVSDDFFLCTPYLLLRSPHLGQHNKLIQCFVCLLKISNRSGERSNSANKENSCYRRNIEWRFRIPIVSMVSIRVSTVDCYQAEDEENENEDNEDIFVIHPLSCSNKHHLDSFCWILVAFSRGARLVFLDHSRH
jgi:hypothetical protein